MLHGPGSGQLGSHFANSKIHIIAFLDINTVHGSPSPSVPSSCLCSWIVLLYVSSSLPLQCSLWASIVDDGPRHVIATPSRRHLTDLPPQLDAIPSVGPSGHLSSYYGAARFILHAKAMIQEGYDQASFPLPTTTLLFSSDPISVQGWIFQGTNDEPMGRGDYRPTPPRRTSQDSRRAAVL